MRKYLFVTIVAVLSLATAPQMFAAAGPAPEAIRPYVGDWVGGGWGSEVRFRQSQREFIQQVSGVSNLPVNQQSEKTIMSLTVMHVSHYHFKVDEKGDVSGEGEITYNLFPNLCGVAALTKQVNSQVNMMAKMPTIFKLATAVGQGALQRFNAEFITQQSKLAAKISEIDNMARAAETVGYPQQTASETADKIMRTLVLSEHHPEVEEDLIAAVVWQNCLDPKERIAGTTPPCLDLLVRPARQSMKTLQQAALNAGLKLVFGKLKSATKETLQNLDLRSQEEAAACSTTGDALEAGTQVGPATLGQLGVNMAGSGAKAAMEMATGSFPHSMLLSIPGVTQVQYYYKGLTKGPESRDFKLRGHLVPDGKGAKLYLEIDGDVSGGDKQLYVEYMVNYKKEIHPFPTWTPFLPDPADAQPSGIEPLFYQTPNPTQAQYKDGLTGEARTSPVAGKPSTKRIDLVMGVPFAAFHQTGSQRNGVRVWHEYEYFWNAWKVMEPIPTGVTP